MSNKFFLVRKDKKTGEISYFYSSLVYNGILKLFLGRDEWVFHKKDASLLDDENYSFPDLKDETDNAFYSKEFIEL